MKHKHTLRTGISLLLVLCMVLSLCPLTAFAKEDKLNLVSFGDSMTNGYGHEGYYESGTQVNGFRQNDQCTNEEDRVTTTYPYYLKQMLKSTYDRSVNWEALAVSCMRTEDVNFLLRYDTDNDAWNTLAQNLDDSSTYGGSTVDNWNGGAKTAWESTFIDDNGNVLGDYFTWNEFVQGRFRDWRKTTGNADKDGYTWNSNPTLAYAKYYQNAVKNADVITLGTGNANFGVIMLQNLTSYLTGTFGSGFKDAVPVKVVIERRFPAEIKDTALEILDKVDALVVPKLGTLGEEKAAKVLEIVEHTTVSFMFSYIDMLYAIDELNDKDLDVIMMGLMNTMDGVKIDTGNGILDLGAVVDGITDVLSAYYFVLPVALQELNGDFENITFYIVPNDDHIDMQVSDMASLDKIKGSNTIRERMIQEVGGMIFNLVRGGTVENPGLNGALKAARGDDAPQLPVWGSGTNKDGTKYITDGEADKYRKRVEAYEDLQADYAEWVEADPKNAPFNVLAKIGEGEDAPYKYAALIEGDTFNANDALACAVYLAFEQAIIKNAKNATLDLAGLMSLMDGTDGLADMITPIATSLTTALGEEAQTALTNKVAASVAAQLVATNKAQYNTDAIKEAIGTQITALGDGEETPALRSALEGIKNQALVPVDGVGTAWYNLSFTDENASDNMTSVGGTLSAFADSMDATKEGNVIAAPTAMFTAIELTNALNGALGGALTSEDEAAKSLGGLLSLFARMIIGSGIGSHPTANGHLTLFNEIKEVYPDKPAKEQLIEMATEGAEWLYNYAVANGEEALMKAVDFAASMGWLEETQADALKNEIAAAYDAINGENDLREYCEALAAKLYKYANDNADTIKEYYEEYLPYAKDLAEKLYDYAVENGDEALDFVLDFVVRQDWLTQKEANVVKTQVLAANSAYFHKDKDALYENCCATAAYIYAYACENGYVPEKVQKAVNEFFKVYNEVKDKNEDELKTYVKEQLKALAEKYGPEALEKLNEYVLTLKVLDAQQLDELEAKIWDFVNAYPDDPDAAIDAAIDELVDFLFEVTPLDKEKVVYMYEYLTTTSREQMLADAAELMQKYLDKYGPEALECVENYLIEEGYVTAEEIAEITKQVKLAIAAHEAQDKEAMKESCEKLAELIYDYADKNGYVPDEVKEAYAKAIELYNKYGEMTPEEIKDFAEAELKKFIAEHKVEALIALDTYLVNEGWMSTTELKELAGKVADAIAAYKADPEGAANAMIEELVNYIYNKAVAEGYIDPAKVEELDKLVDLIKNACDYFANTSEEQMKADAVALLFAELDKLTDGKVNAEVYAQIKADVAGLIVVLEGVKLDDIWTTVYTYIDSVKGYYLALVGELVDAATHGKYVPNGESYYVALGGKTVYGAGLDIRSEKAYADLLLAELGKLGLSKENYMNLGDKDGLLTTGILAYIEDNANEIKKADLITYQIDATAFGMAAVSEETPDWSKYLTEEQIAFVEQALPVIQTILEDDWTKYAELDADEIVDDIKSDVFDAIDDAIMDAFNGQADKLDELLSICVAQVKSYVEYIQEQAVELYIEAVKREIVLFHSLMEPVYEVLGEDWASYAHLDVDEIVDKIKGEVLEKADDVKGFSKDKITEGLEHCVKKALDLHECAEGKIEELQGYLNEEELAFAQAAFEYVWEYALKQWSELEKLDVEKLHEHAYNEIMKRLNEADDFDYEEYVGLGAKKIKKILNCCVDKAMAAIGGVQEEAYNAAEKISEAQFEFLMEALKFAFKYLLAEDWSEYVDKGAAWVSNQIKDAVIAEMYKHSSFGKEYIDQYADDLTEVLTACIEEAQNVLQTAQNKKDEVLNVLNKIEPFKPYIENLLFASVAYAVDTAKAVDAIQAINPDATLIVVGMYNPLDGLVLNTDDATINVGDYMDYIINATNAYYTALAVADGEFIFVPVPDTKITGFVDITDFSKLVGLLPNWTTRMYADADGHEYIFEQIMDALDTTNELVSIRIKTAPSKTSYVAGDNFDSTGMVIEATYYNGTTADVTGWTVTDGTALTAGKTTVTISYTEGDVTKTTTQAITVTSPSNDGPGSVTHVVKPDTKKFVDVPDDAYYADAVKWAVENGITLGVDDTHFAPMAIATRGQMVTFLWRAAGCPEPTATTCAFTDVKADAYYYKAVLWAVETGITKGTSDTTFSPDENVSRSQTVTLLARMNGVKDDATGYSHDFADVKTTDYFNNAVAWAATNEITNGTSATTFSPNDDCLRGQVVTFLYRNFVK